MIYLDYAATTACDPEVVSAMMPFFSEIFANASSIDHFPGSVARKSVDAAREDVAYLVGAKPEDVIFTSGSTESNNIALSTSRPVLTTKIEHPSILEPFAMRGTEGDRFIQLDERGLVDLGALGEMLKSAGRAATVSVIATNNETGIEQDIEELNRITSLHGASLHLDVTQAVGSRRISIGNSCALSISAHKINGPKGVGALIASPSFRREIKPLTKGGGHERGFRSGTLNVPGIVGFGYAARLLAKDVVSRRNRLSKLRASFLGVLQDSLAEIIKPTVREDVPCSPHILSLQLVGINARALLGAVRQDVAFSLGSACATNKSEPSHVLLAMGFNKKASSEIMRFSFASEQPVEEVEKAAHLIAIAARSLSGYSVSY